MKAVGVKELKARLSEYLRAVEAGETVLVTRHDEVVAELSPPRKPERGALEERLDVLSAMGQLTRARLPKKDWAWRVDGLGLPAGTAATLLGELRGERRED
jgi:antitoxin (DNA-binding transcriptional repressor) of toxin-antitoxin stability system